MTAEQSGLKRMTRAGLAVQIFVIRLGWAFCIGVLFVVAAIATFMLILPLIECAQREASGKFEKIKNNAAKTSTAKTDTNPIEQELALLRSRVAQGVPEATEEQIFICALKAQLQVGAVNYQLRNEESVNFKLVQMSLSLRGQYRGVRAMLDAIASDLPNVILEGLSIKREGIGTDESEIALRLLVFVHRFPERSSAQSTSIRESDSQQRRAASGQGRE